MANVITNQLLREYLKTSGFQSTLDAFEREHSNQQQQHAGAPAETAAPAEIAAHSPLPAAALGEDDISVQECDGTGQEDQDGRSSVVSGSMRTATTDTDVDASNSALHLNLHHLSTAPDSIPAVSMASVLGKRARGSASLIAGLSSPSGPLCVASDVTPSQDRDSELPADASSCSAPAGKVARTEKSGGSASAAAHSHSPSRAGLTRPVALAIPSVTLSQAVHALPLPLPPPLPTPLHTQTHTHAHTRVSTPQANGVKRTPSPPISAFAAATTTAGVATQKQQQLAVASAPAPHAMVSHMPFAGMMQTGALGQPSPSPYMTSLYQPLPLQQQIQLVYPYGTDPSLFGARMGLQGMQVHGVEGMGMHVGVNLGMPMGMSLGGMGLAMGGLYNGLPLSMVPASGTTTATGTHYATPYHGMSGLPASVSHGGGGWPMQTSLPGPMHMPPAYFTSAGVTSMGAHPHTVGSHEHASCNGLAATPYMWSGMSVCGMPGQHSPHSTPQEEYESVGDSASHTPSEGEELVSGTATPTTLQHSSSAIASNVAGSSSSVSSVSQPTARGKHTGGGGGSASATARLRISTAHIEPDAAGKFHCPELNCVKSFTQRTNLRRHLIGHTGEKPFACEVCQKAFTRSDDLAIHTRTHTGNKPYQCSDCERRFARVSDLNAHAKMHLSESSLRRATQESAMSELGTLTGLLLESAQAFSGGDEESVVEGVGGDARELTDGCADTPVEDAVDGKTYTHAGSSTATATGSGLHHPPGGSNDLHKLPTSVPTAIAKSHNAASASTRASTSTSCAPAAGAASSATGSPCRESSSATTRIAHAGNRLLDTHSGTRTLVAAAPGGGGGGNGGSKRVSPHARPRAASMQDKDDVDVVVGLLGLTTATSTTTTSHNNGVTHL